MSDDSEEDHPLGTRGKTHIQEIILFAILVMAGVYFYFVNPQPVIDLIGPDAAAFIGLTADSSGQ